MEPHDPRAETDSDRSLRESREPEQRRRFPQVEHVWTATSRVSRLSGTGIQIWQVIRAWNRLDRDKDRLQMAFDMLTPEQLELALDFYAAFPDEIDERIAGDETWTRARAAALNEELAKYRT